MYIHGQKLSSWASSLGWVAGNTEARWDDVLARSFLQVGKEDFSVRAGLGEEGQTGFPSLSRE